MVPVVVASALEDVEVKVEVSCVVVAMKNVKVEANCVQHIHVHTSLTQMEVSMIHTEASVYPLDSSPFYKSTIPPEQTATPSK